VLTQGIDIRKIALHYVVRAWRPDATGFTIDYDVQEIHGTRYGTDEGVDLAVRKAILARMDELREEQPYRTIDRLSIDETERQYSVAEIPND
jgi:hypothetical protein